MKYKKLGRTDIEVSTVCMGCWAIVGDSVWGHQDQQEAIDAIHAALDVGINFFDTAEAYGSGRSEKIIAKALGDRIRDVVIATKVSPDNLDPSALREHCEASLLRLNADTIDLYQIHWPSADRPVAETLGVMEDLKAEGRIRAIGVSNFGSSYLTDLVDAGRVETNQLPYSLLWRPIEHEIQPLCIENDIGVLCYSPLHQGLLTGKFASADDVPEGRARSRLFSKDRPQSRHYEPGCEEATFAAIDRIREICEAIDLPMAAVSLAWLLTRDAVTSVIAGIRNPKQALENARAAEIDLDPSVIEQLSQATEEVKAYVGTNADMWQTDTRMER